MELTQKLKKCVVCKTPFKQFRTIETWCSFDCALKLVETKKQKAINARRRSDKERLKTRADHLREAQALVNAFVRERDRDKPCISCGRFHTGQHHAGHYRSVGSCPELRFDADFNIHKQCSVCNNHLSGNLINYRRNLIIKIGLEKVEWLESNHPPLKLTIEDIKAIKAKYKQLLKQLIS